MKAAVRIILPALALVATSLIARTAPVTAQVQNQTPPAIKEGRQLEHDGKLADALALYEKSLKDDPNSYGVNIAAGEVLDLLGRHDEARQHFEQAIAHADSVERRAMGQRAEAMSYAFEGNCSETSLLEEELISYYRGIVYLHHPPTAATCRAKQELTIWSRPTSQHLHGTRAVRA